MARASQTREFGIVMEAAPGRTAGLAADLEAMGFDILLCPDTQNLSPDPYGQLSLAAARTSRLKLGTGVTNPLTRDAAVTASAISALQMESGGRCICGLGRGDSSLAHIGRSSATTAQLRACAEQVRAYCQGLAVRRGERDSSLRWLDPDAPPPAPIDIACTGPRTIRMAADVADRISFAVGSAPERIRWALAVARQRLRQTGRPREELRIGAYINLVCDPDEQRAINLGRMIAGMVAHFAGMKHAPLEHLPRPLQILAEKMRSGYDMGRHGQDQGAHLALVDDEFVDWFSICGPPAKCLARMEELLALGLDHVYVLGGSPVAAPHGARQAAMVEQTRLFAEAVLPKLRQGGRGEGNPR